MATEACSRTSTLPCATLGRAPPPAPPRWQRILADRLRTDGWRRHATTRATTVGEVFLAYLAAQLDRLLVQDRAFRAGAVDEPVHQMRVAARRLRSALATFRPLVDSRAVRTAESLREELRWLGSSLARGTRHHGAPGPPRHAARGRRRTPRPWPLAATSTRCSRANHRVALDHAAGVLDDPRYLRLARRPRGVPRARPRSRPAPTARRAGAAVGAARRGQAVPPPRPQGRAGPRRPSQERALHDVRKAAKRLRYAAEAATPVLGAQAEELAARAEAVQEVLGEHQDTVVSRAALHDLAHHGEATGPVGLGLGRLAAARGRAGRRAPGRERRRHRRRRAHARAGSGSDPAEQPLALLDQPSPQGSAPLGERPLLPRRTSPCPRPSRSAPGRSRGPRGRTARPACRARGCRGPARSSRRRGPS